MRAGVERDRLTCKSVCVQKCKITDDPRRREPYKPWHAREERIFSVPNDERTPQTNWDGSLA